MWSFDMLPFRCFNFPHLTARIERMCLLSALLTLYATLNLVLSAVMFTWIPCNNQQDNKYTCIPLDCQIKQKWIGGTKFPDVVICNMKVLETGFTFAREVSKRDYYDRYASNATISVECWTKACIGHPTRSNHIRFAQSHWLARNIVTTITFVVINSLLLIIMTPMIFFLMYVDGKFD